MGKDKRTFRNKGISLFKDARIKGKYYYCPIYGLVSQNITRNLSSCKKPSLRSRRAADFLFNYLSGM